MQTNQVNEESLDLKKLFFKYLPHWYLFAISAFLALCGAFVFNQLKEPEYLVKSTMLIRENQVMIPVVGEIDIYSGRSNWFNEKAILRSNTLIEKVLQDLDVGVSYYSLIKNPVWSIRTEIYHNSPFRIYLHPELKHTGTHRYKVQLLGEDHFTFHDSNGYGILNQGRRYTFGEMITTEDVSFMVELTDLFDPSEHTHQVFEFVIHDPGKLTSTYAGGLKVEPVGPGYSIVEISFKATNEQRATDFADRLTAQYIEENLREKNKIALNTIAFIDEQIAITSESLSMAETGLQDFRQDRQLIDVSLISTQLINELQMLDHDMSELQVRRRYYAFLLEFADNNRDFNEVFAPASLGINDPILNTLLMDLSKMYSERTRLLLTTTESSPRIQSLDREIAQRKNSLDENLRSLLAASDIMLHDLSRRTAQVEARINELPHTERELMGIQRLFNLNDATYNYLLQKRSEAGIALASNMPDHRVIDPARSMGQVSPKKQMNYMLALMASLLLPLALLTLRDFLNTRITDKELVVKETGLPVVGMIPRHPQSKKPKHLQPVILDTPQSKTLEAFRSMRANLQFFSPEASKKMILVTSTRAKEGKTFTALNLAASLALSSRKTLLLDTDLRKPSTSLNGGSCHDRGLSNYLIGQLSLDNIMIPSKHHKNLYQINAGTVPPNPAELIDSEKMNVFMEGLHDFDFIVVDTPPIGLVADAQPLVKHATIILYVIRHGFSLQTDLHFIREFKEKSKVNKLVLAINDVKNVSKYSHYGYGYGYGGK